MVNKHVPLESSHGSHANPQPFPRAQQPSSAAGLQSPSSSYEEQSFGVGMGSPGQNQSQGKSRARVVEFDGQGDTSALEKSRQPASQADATSGGQSNVKGGAWGRHQVSTPTCVQMNALRITSSDYCIDTCKTMNWRSRVTRFFLGLAMYFCREAALDALIIHKLNS
mmetsp:Transcript_5771/g.10387  ORF Transcript_5771/g.10387 Transcript_5771/m.10387 type:complete len:167 (-) Transcript_5771:18-518(-)